MGKPCSSFRDLDGLVALPKNKTVHHESRVFLYWILPQRNCCLGQSGGSYLLNETDKALPVRQGGCCRGTNNPSDIPAPSVPADHPLPESCAQPADPSIPAPWETHAALSGNHYALASLLEIPEPPFFSFSYVHVLAPHLGDQGAGLK